jgi:hypothetical protein
LDPRDFIGLAQDLLDGIVGDGAPQSTHRTVVNRAYLGALLFSAQVLTGAKGAVYPRDHTYYEKVESDLYDVVGGRLKDRLTSLREWRTMADYEMAQDINPRMSADSIALANYLVTEIEAKFL